MDITTTPVRMRLPLQFSPSYVMVMVLGLEVSFTVMVASQIRPPNGPGTPFTCSIPITVVPLPAWEVLLFVPVIDTWLYRAVLASLETASDSFETMAWSSACVCRASFEFVEPGFVVLLLLQANTNPTHAMTNAVRKRLFVFII